MTKLSILNQLINLGVHLGHHKDLATPYAQFFLLGVRTNYLIFNLSHTIIYLRVAMQWLKLLGRLNAHLLFYHSTFTDLPLQIRLFLTNLISVQHDFSLVDIKWHYGQLSNFYTYAYTFIDNLRFYEPKIETYDRYLVSSSLDFFNLLHRVLFYTYNERIPSVSWAVHFMKMLKFWRFLFVFKHYNNFKRYPDLFIFLGPDNSVIPPKEAHGRHLPILSILDTNSLHVRLATYFIPGNDDSVLLSIFYFQLFINSYLLGRTQSYLDLFKI